jgi:hypothetical protein
MESNGERLKKIRLEKGITLELNVITIYVQIGQGWIL